MIRIEIGVKDPHADLLAVKEGLALYCERYGDLTLIDVREEQPAYRQTKIWTGLEEDCPW